MNTNPGTNDLALIIELNLPMSLKTAANIFGVSPKVLETMYERYADGAVPKPGAAVFEWLDRNTQLPSKHTKQYYFNDVVNIFESYRKEINNKKNCPAIESEPGK